MLIVVGLLNAEQCWSFVRQPCFPLFPQVLIKKGATKDISCFCFKFASTAVVKYQFIHY